MTRALVTLAALLLLGVSQAWAQTPTPTPVTCGGPDRYLVCGDAACQAAFLGVCRNQQECWSCTSGGATNASIPDATINCHLDANTATSAQEIRLSQPTHLVCKTFDETGLVAANVDPGGVILDGTTVAANWTSVAGGLIANGGGSPDLAGISFSAVGGTQSITAPWASSIDNLGVWILGSDQSGVTPPTWTQQTDLNFDSSTHVELDYGTLDMNGHNLTGGGLVFSTHGASFPIDILAGSSTFTFTSGTSPSGGLQLGTADATHTAHVSNATLIIWDDSRQKLQTGGLTWGAVHITLAASHNGVEWENGGTISHLTLDAGVRVDMDAFADTGATWTFGQVDCTGTGDAPITWQSFDGGVAWTFTATQTVACDWLNVTDSDCEGVTPCYAGANGTVDAFSAAHNWLAQDAPATPTPTPTFDTPTPTPTATPTVNTPTPTATKTPCPNGRCPHAHRPFWLGRDQGRSTHNEETQGR